MTSYAKGSLEPSAAPLDYSKHRELDHTLINACSRSSVQDVRSRQTLQIGRTTHYIQEVHLRVPIFRRRPRPAPRGFPRAVWQDSELCSLVLANLIDTLERRLYGDPQIVNVHLYDPLNVRVPPSSRRHDEVGLFLDINFDGSHTSHRTLKTALHNWKQVGLLLLWRTSPCTAVNKSSGTLRRLTSSFGGAGACARIPVGRSGSEPASTPTTPASSLVSRNRFYGLCLNPQLNAAAAP